MPVDNAVEEAALSGVEATGEAVRLEEVGGETAGEYGGSNLVGGDEALIMGGLKRCCWPNSGRRMASMEKGIPRLSARLAGRKGWKRGKLASIRGRCSCRAAKAGGNRWVVAGGEALYRGEERSVAFKVECG